MEILFKLVSSMEEYADDYGYHAHFFEEAGGFTTALLIALGVAAVCAAIYYFGFCMSHKTVNAATLPVWIVFLVLAGGISFLGSDVVVVGSSSDGDSESVFDGFYADLDSYYLELVNPDGGQAPPKMQQEEMNREKNNIINHLDQGDDVGLMLCLNTALWSLIFFYIFSVILKGFTTTGVAIPHLAPHSRK